MTKFDPERLFYNGADINGDYVDHEFYTKNCDYITLTITPSGAFSTLRVSTKIDGDFGMPKNMPDAFTSMLLVRLQSVNAVLLQPETNHSV